MPEQLEYRQAIYQTYASGFQKAAERFDVAAARHWGAPYNRYLRGWLPNDLNAGILDAGCGNGRLLHFLREKGYSKLTGIDISAEQVALSRQVIPNAMEGNCLDFLDRCDEQFDLILGMDIIEHLKKNEALRFLAGCARVLRPGGRLVLQTPNAESPWFGAVRYGDFTHETCYCVHSLRSLLELQGFENVEARETGPVIRGAKSIVRAAGWQGLRLAAKLWNLFETGTTGSGVFTRVFLISGIRKQDTSPIQPRA